MEWLKTHQHNSRLVRLFFSLQLFLTAFINASPAWLFLWWWQAGHLPSAALLFPSTHFCYFWRRQMLLLHPKKESESDAFWQNRCLLPLLEMDIRCQSRFSNGFSLSPYVDLLSILEMCSLMLLISNHFQLKKCVIESGHPWILLTPSGVPLVCSSAFRSILATIRVGACSCGLLVLYDFKETLRVTSPILALSVLVRICPEFKFWGLPPPEKRVVAPVVYPYLSLYGCQASFQNHLNVDLGGAWEMMWSLPFLLPRTPGLRAGN